MSPSNYKIPFNKPSLVGKEQEYIFQAMSSGHMSGDGSFTHKCQSLLERLLDVPCVLLSTSCTDALEMAALLLDIQPGDEVIIPSFTFVSTANAFVNSPVSSLTRRATMFLSWLEARYSSCAAWPGCTSPKSAAAIMSCSFMVLIPGVELSSRVHSFAKAP